MDAAIRVSPHSTSIQQRFLILKPAQHHLKFFQIEHVKKKDLKYKELSQHTDFSNVRAFDWSPTEEAIVAVGLSGGEAALLRIDDSSNGLLSFNFKNPRPCNAIALSLNGHLAAGLDKVRNDFCLNIWDINHRLSSWDRKAKGWASTRPQYEPMRKLASSETISSVKFFSDVPETLVTGVKGQFVRIYDLREYPGEPSIQFPTRCAHNLSIDTQDENYFASASNSGEPTVCLWDRRAGPHHSAAVLTSGHAAQSFHSGPILEYRNCLEASDALSSPSIWSVRFCRSRRGVFGVLSNQGQLKVYEMAKEYVAPSQTASTTRQTQQHQDFRSPQPLYTKRSRDVQRPFQSYIQGPSENERIESFDFLASGQTGEKYSIIACRCNGSLEVINLEPQPPPIDQSVGGEIAVAIPGRALGVTYRARSPSDASLSTPRQESTTIAQAIKSIRARIHLTRTDNNQGLKSADKGPNTSAKIILSSREKRSENMDLTGLSTTGRSSPGLGPGDALVFSTVEKRRAQEGYLFDCAANVQLLLDDPGLQDLWKWVKGAEDAATQAGMVHEQLDLSYLGIHSVWSATLGSNISRRTAADNGRLATQEEFVHAVRGINERQKRAPFNGIKTNYPDLRQMCLAICDWIISEEQFESELERIKTRESRTKAAAWAMFHGYPKRAIDVVLKGDDADKLVAMALAAFYNTAGLTKEDHTEAWSSLCNEISEKAKDPWSKAILALVSTEDWKAVVRETSLPLRDRVGVGLKHLEDDELTGFLNALTRDCIEHGDIEGIWLTGITEETTDLFQNYIAKHNDAQTAVLVMSYSIPLYFDDYRFKHWRDSYCDRLDTYNLHIERCLYTQQHTMKSIGRDGRPLIKPPPRQITVRCNYCDRSVVQVDGETGMEASVSTTGATAVERTSSGTHPGNPLLSRQGAEVDAVCPHCGRHLPRCGVCLMWLGTTDQGRLGQSSEEPLSRFLNFCNMCHHGFHAQHAREWFAKHKMCPIPECECLCAAF